MNDQSNDPTAPPPLGNTCGVCGNMFPPDDLIRLNESWVCATCKPVFLQRLREGAAPIGAGLWRKKKQLVTHSEALLPDRCVRCNAPAHGFKLKRKLSWHPPGYYILVVNLLIYAVVAMLVRKKAVLDMGLCEKHREQRHTGLIVGWSGFLGGLALIIAAVYFDSGKLALGGILAIVGGAIYAGVTGVRVSTAKIADNTVWLNGVNRDYLAQLPEWSGS